MKYRLLACLSLLLTGVLSAQNFNDALRYSFVSPQGSARFAGTGGSLTPMGVDVTTLHTNPAGIGWNRFNLVQITPGFGLTNTDAQLEGDAFGNSLSESAASFNIAGAGAVFAGTTRSVNFSTLNFGISVARMADFNQQVRFEGATEGSLIESFAVQASSNRAGGFTPDAYGEGLARRYLKDTLGSFFSSFYDFDANNGDGAQRGGEVSRSGLYDRRGGITEVALGFGGSYREKLLWGLSIGIPFFRYEEVTTYEEVDDQDFIPNFEDLDYNTNLTASGTGFNLKFGLIYLPTDQLRLSVGLHTPTFYSIDENFSTSLGYFYSEDGAALGGDTLSPLAAYTYNLRTPLRFTLGAGYLIGSKGFISIDADYSSYATNSISFDDFAEVAEDINSDIDAFLGNSIGVRIGGEANFKPFQLRLGVGYRQVPFTEFFRDENEALLTYNAGVGYSIGKFYFDLAGQYEGYSAFQDIYRTGDFSQTVLTDRSRVSVLLTVGFRGWNAGF
jgi:hypothetical protein